MPRQLRIDFPGAMHRRCWITNEPIYGLTPNLRSQYGYWYKNFQDDSQKAWGNDLGSDPAFRFGSGGGRVAITALSVASGVKLCSMLKTPTMNVAFDPGSPFHVAYGSGDAWVHAAGESMGALRVTSIGATRYATTEAVFTVTGIPVLSSSAVLTTGSAATCLGAAINGFVRGWLHFLPFGF
jgi:hypothetical protein